MSDKKIILPSESDVFLYGKNSKKVINPPLNPVEKFEIKKENKDKKKIFYSTIETILSWKDMVKKILNNTDYKNDKR